MLKRKTRKRVIIIVICLVFLAIIAVWSFGKTTFPKGCFDTEEILVTKGCMLPQQQQTVISVTGISAQGVILRCKWLGFHQAPIEKKPEQVYEYRLDFQNGTQVYLYPDGNIGTVCIFDEKYSIQYLPSGLLYQVSRWFQEA